LRNCSRLLLFDLFKSCDVFHINPMAHGFAVAPCKIAAPKAPKELRTAIDFSRE